MTSDKQPDSPEIEAGKAEAKPHEHFEEGEEVAPPGVRTMAVIRWLLVLAMAVAATASIVYVFGPAGHANGNGSGVQYYCPMHPSVVQDHPGECPICSMTLVLREGGKSSSAPAPSASADHAGHRHEASDPYYCPMHPEETGKDASAQCPLCNMKLEPKPAGSATSAGHDVEHASDPYYCLMHPNETGKDASARCPVCGMKLEKKPAGTGTEPTGSAPSMGGELGSTAPSPSGSSASLGEVEGLIPVDIPPERIQLIGMRTAKVQRSKLPSELRAVGYVAPTESGLAVVQTRFSGWIQELHVAQTGEPVARGQLLARVYSPELLSAQQELINAKRWTSPLPESHGASAPPSLNLADNARNRLAVMGMNADEIAEVERTGTPHRLIEVRSPARGYVAQKNALEGLFIQPGTPLFEIADLSKVWVLVEIFEHDAGQVRTGQSATLKLSAYPDETFVGKVQLLYPTLTAATRTLRARLEFKNPALHLRPGMFGEVTLQLSSTEGLVVPGEAVVDTGEQTYVFVAEAGGHFAPRVVRLGVRTDDQVQVLAGLNEGETVVTTGNFLIDSESRLRSAIEGTATAASSTSTPSACDELFDRNRFADKYAQCRACEAQHHGMGTMEDDCRNAIPKPWR